MKTPILLVPTAQAQEILVRALYGVGYRFVHYRDVDAGWGGWRDSSITANGKVLYPYIQASGGQISARRLLHPDYLKVNSIEQFVRYATRLRASELKAAKEVF